MDIELIRNIIKSKDFSRIVKELSLEDRKNIIRHLSQEDEEFFEQLTHGLEEVFSGDIQEWTTMLSSFLTNEEAIEIINDPQEDFKFKAYSAMSASDEEKIKFVDDSFTKEHDIYHLLDVLLSIKNDEKKIECLKKNLNALDSYNIEYIISSIKDTNLKISAVNEPEIFAKISGYNLCEIFESIKDINEKRTFLKNPKVLEKIDDDVVMFLWRLKSASSKIMVLEDPEILKKMNGYNIEELIVSFDDDSQKLLFLKRPEILEKLENINIVSVISSFKDDSNKLSILEEPEVINKMYPSDIADILVSLNDDSQKISFMKRPYISERLSEFNMSEILFSIKDESKRISLLKDQQVFEKTFSSEVERIIASVNSDSLKMEALEDSQILKKIGGSCIRTVISSFRDDSLKIQFVKRPEIFKEMSSFTLAHIIASIDDSTIIKQVLKEDTQIASKLSKHELPFILSTIRSDKAKIDLLKDPKILADLKKENGIRTVISSIREFDNEAIEFIKRIVDNIDLLYKSDIQKIIEDADKETQGLLIEMCMHRVETITLMDNIEAYNDFERKIANLKKYKDRFTKNDIRRIVRFSSGTLTEKLILMKASGKLEIGDIDSYISTSLCPNYIWIGEGAKKELSERVTRIIEKYKDIEPSMSDLNSLIGRQAKINYAEHRRENARNYLPSGLAEQINLITQRISYDEIFNDIAFDHYNNKMLSVTKVDDFKKRTIADKLKTCNSWNREKLINKVNEKEIPLLKRFDQIKLAESNLSEEARKEIERILFSDKKNLSEDERRKLYDISGLTLEGIKSLSHEQVKQLENTLGVVLTMDGMKKALGVEWTEEECKLFLTLEEQLSIKRDNPELMIAYFNSVKEALADKKMNLSELFSTINVKEVKNPDAEFDNMAEKFREIFALATKRTILKAIIDENRGVPGSLLTQICTYALNCEQRIEEEKETKLLESLVAGELLLTDKGREKIESNRVVEILKRDSNLYEVFEDKNVKFNEKMNIIFSKMYPSYQGKAKDLKVLHSLMIGDEKYKEELSMEPTLEERKVLPIKPYYFTFDKELQKEKLMVSILNAVNVDRLSPGEEKLSTGIIGRLDALEDSIDLMLKDNSLSKEIGSLMFEELGLVDRNSISDLLLFYKKIKTSKAKNDTELSKKEFNIDNLKEYVDRSKKYALRGSKIYSTLGEVTTEVLEAGDTNTYCDHYIRNTSKRMYRTIPDIEGKFEDYGGKVISYRSYKVDDPEQLIAGARFKDSPVRSCLQLGHPQGSTLTYLTSSPNGTIVAAEDENGEFLGRVYGYRIGNSVHFTRIYYMSPNQNFDYEKFMDGIGKSIIENSEDIDYVTCIPFSSSWGVYGKKETVLVNVPEDIKNVQDSNYSLTTDHGAHNHDQIRILASRKPVLSPDDVEFTREEITEKFYKKRKEPCEIDLKNEENEQQLSAASNIVFRSECPHPNEVIDSLSRCEQITLGEDYIVVDTGNEIMSLKINYGDSEEAKKYGELVDEEIKREAEKLKEKRNKNSQESSQSNKPLDELTKEELMQMKEEIINIDLDEKNNERGKGL